MSEFLNPKKVLDEIFLTPNMIAADFGCGSGGWTIPLAKKLHHGKVYAIDILSEPLSVLNQKAKSEDVSNIQTIKGDLEKENGSGLKEESCDFVLIANVLFQSEKKENILKEAKRVLKPNGEVLIIDWKKTSFLAPKEGKVDVEELKNLIQKLGFEIKKEFFAGEHHFGLLAKKTLKN